MRSPWSILLSLVILGVLASIACATAMRSTGCRWIPSVEECRRIALRITNQCLRQCVIAQCSGVVVRCGDKRTLAGCKEVHQGEGVGGFADKLATSCAIPLDEIHWCELPVPQSCQSLMMVHELAHSCGWSHDAGMGVPGNRGRLAWRDECE